MMKMTPGILILRVALVIPVAAGIVTEPQWKPQISGTTASLRGISAANPQVAWASGAKGTFLRTVDGGTTWQAGAVPGAEQLDFRDVQAFDAQTVTGRQCGRRRTAVPEQAAAQPVSVAPGAGMVA